jgi:hypothetical protein
MLSFYKELVLKKTKKKQKCHEEIFQLFICFVGKKFYKKKNQRNNENEICDDILH